MYGPKAQQHEQRRLLREGAGAGHLHEGVLGRLQLLEVPEPIGSCQRAGLNADEPSSGSTHVSMAGGITQTSMIPPAPVDDGLATPVSALADVERSHGWTCAKLRAHKQLRSSLHAKRWIQAPLRRTTESTRRAAWRRATLSGPHTTRIRKGPGFPGPCGTNGGM